MEIEGKGNILDVGCGNGDFKNWFVDCNYFGIDLKKRWLTNLPNLFVSDISKGVPKRLSDKKFDYIVALALIEHLKKPEKFLNDIKRRLASGGKIILTTPHPLGEKAYGFGVRIGMFSKEAAEEHENLLSKKDFIKFSKKCNLKMVKYKRFLFGLNQLVVYENGKNRNFR